MPLSRFAHRTQAFAARQHLLPQGGRVLVAISGGPDSTALLRVLYELSPLLKLSLTAAHLHHGLRSKAADGDAAFAAALAAALHIPYLQSRSDVRRTARRRGISLEMAARDARYRFLARAARKVGATVVATGHNADDLAETMLLKLTRGTGPRGLRGIAPLSSLRGLTVIRPLLFAERSEIEQYLRGVKQEWRDDESNKDPRHLRNRVRHEILPLLADRLNPRIRQALTRLAVILRDEDEWMEQMTLRLGAECMTPDGAILASSLAAIPRAARRRLLLRWLTDCGYPPEAMSYEAIERLDLALTQGHGSRSLTLERGWKMLLRGNHARILRAADRVHEALKPSAPLPIPGRVDLPVWGLRATIRIRPGLKKQAGCKPGELPAEASLALDPIKGRTLIFRSWKCGDRMRPFGMTGSRKVQDIFGDAKIPPERRHAIPLLVAGREIVWIPGYRIARGWEVRNASEPALQIRLLATGRRNFGKSPSV